MGTFVLTDASVVINSVDLSDHVMSVTVNYSADMVEDTNMGDDTHTMLGGLKNWSMDIEFSQDFAAGEVDATMFSIVGSAVAIVVKPTSAAVSATNPSYSGTCVVENYNPIAGSVGDKATATCTVQAGGTLSRNTA